MQEKQILEEKAKEKYEEWRTIKKKKEREERMKRKQEQELQQRKLFEKKMSAGNAYKLWLQENKKRNNSNYINIDQKSNNDIINNLYNSPSPDFINPLPWVGTVELNNEKSNKTMKKNRNNKNRDMEYCSPPMLWEEVEQRQKRKLDMIYNESSSRKSIK